MWVKICANTNVEDTLAAIEFGADAVGFVFAPSKRQVTTAQVRAITSALPLEIERVGVFPAWPASRIVEAAIHAGLTAVQLHGGYDPSITDAIQALVPTLDVIEVAHWTVGADAAARDAVARSVARLQAQSRGGEASRMLIDAKVDAVSGGTGVAFDWESARPVFASAASLRLVLAGGLHPESVQDAIRTLHPWGVDVASGVEVEPGKKDLGRLRVFIEQARS
jgi:phosphoribosylanthranilate isomerase